MLGDTQRRLIEDCPECGKPLEVTDEQPLTRVICPSCRKEVTVRRLFNQFVITKKLGEGGMSRVYLAEDRSLGRKVALKILNRRFSRDEDRVAQFEKEARITALVTHPNVVRIYSVGRAQGLFFIAMELVSGGSLEEWIREERVVGEEELMRYATGVAKGLRAAHHAGLVHRDIKPGNILFSEEGVPKIVDFGLSLVYKMDVDTSGEIWGTPFYVPPEKLDRRPDSFRGDIYSLGATLYHVLVGRPPHDAQTSSIDELRKIKARPIDLKADFPGISDETAEVINRMTRVEPTERYDDYDELVEALRLAYTRLENPGEVVGIRREPASAVSVEGLDDPMARRLFWLGGVMTALALTMGLMVVLRGGGDAGSSRYLPGAKSSEPAKELGGTEEAEGTEEAAGTEEAEGTEEAAGTESGAADLKSQSGEQEAKGASAETKGEGAGILEEGPSSLPSPEPDTGEAEVTGVGDRFLEARERMLSGEVDAARKEFTQIAETRGAPVSTRRWAAFNSGICLLLEGRADASRQSFGALGRLIETNPDLEGDGLDAFFRLLSERMVEERVPDPVIKASFDRDSAEVLGLLALGMKAWQMGAWETAMGFFDAFEVTERASDFGWVDSYRALLSPFREDYEIVAAERLLRRDLDEDEVVRARSELERLAGGLQTAGRAPAAIALQIEWLDAYAESLAAAESDAEEVAESRRVATIEPGEILGLQAIVAAMDRESYEVGYRFADAMELLEQGLAGFESAAVREAVGHHLYLWRTAEAFVVQLVEDLDGEVYRRLGDDEEEAAGVQGDKEEAAAVANPLGFKGEIVGANRDYLSVDLEFGESRFALADIPPEGLVEMAVSIADRTPDSNEHYRRRELIAAFVHLTMPEPAGEYIDDLMEENRPFRERWIRAMASTAR